LPTLSRTLTEHLRSAPGDKSDEAAAVAAQAARLVGEATAEKPNRTLLQVLSSGLKQTAAFLKDSVPDAFTIAGQITSLVARLHGTHVNTRRIRRQCVVAPAGFAVRRTNRPVGMCRASSAKTCAAGPGQATA
jgi:hypothetical protein